MKSRNPENDKILRRKKAKKSKKVCRILAVIQLLLSVAFMGLVAFMGMLPEVYLMIAGALLFVFVFISFALGHGRKTRTFGKIWSILISLAMIAGLYYVGVGNGALSAITGNTIQTIEVSVLVLEEDSAKSLSDVKDYRFGISKTVDRTNTDKAIASIEKKTKNALNYKAYKDYNTMVSALYHKKVKAIIFNEAFRGQFEEEYENFSKETRVIKTFTYKQIIKNTGNVSVTKEPFIVFLSGNDQTGAVSTTGRSDVNLLAVVNPTTKQVLLISTPRDSYVELVDPSGNIGSGNMDKLTHAGNFGVDVSMSTLGGLYGCQIDYYVMLNFSGFENIINALGGITIDCEESFTSVDGMTYKAGTQSMDGIHALNYARERKAFADGDLARNRHETQVMTAIIDKMLSPAILSNYATLMEGAKDSFRTSLESSDITALVRMQLKDSADWNIKSYHVTGSSARNYTYSISSSQVSTVVLDEDSVSTASSLIQKVLSGATISDRDV